MFVFSSVLSPELHGVQQLRHGVPGSVRGRLRAGLRRERHRPGRDRVLHGQRERSGGRQRDVQLLPRPRVRAAERLGDPGAEAHVTAHPQGQRGRSAFTFSSTFQVLIQGFRS